MNEFSLQSFQSKCLLCPYVSYDISVMIAVIFFTVYGTMHQIYALQQNGSIFILMKILPTMKVMKFYQNFIELDS